jgi:ankyrin repeat protein
MTALVAAASRGDVSGVQRLLKEGASVNEFDSEGSSAMGKAVSRGHIPVVKCLIQEGGVDIDAAMHMIAAGNRRYSALSWAAIYADYPLAPWLLEEGALIPTNIWEILRIYQFKLCLA